MVKCRKCDDIEEKIMAKKLVLPQNDPNGKKKRERYFKRMRQLYQYDLSAPYFSFNGNLAFLTTKGLAKWWVVWPSLKLTLLTLYKVVMFVPLLIYIGLKRLIKGYPFPEFKDYYFFFFKRPDRQYLDNFNDDTYFGLQRVSGPNPTWIERITEDHQLPERFKADDIVSQLTGQSYEAALQEKRLYLADYSLLKVMVDHPKEIDGRKQYTTNPVALFYRQDNGLLRPLAIQLYATEPASPQNPVYTPADGEHWMMAKMFVQTADLIVQTVWTHSMRSHYLVGSLVLATYRNLSQNHPLFALLKPHWQDTLAVNTLIRYYRPTHAGGKIPLFGLVLPCEQNTLAEFFGKGMRTYSFTGSSFPNDIKKQGLEDPNLFYPYRDDGQLVWEAIHEFARDYVHLYYQSDQDVVADFELQAWGDEIGGSLQENKMGIPDFPTQFNTIDDVVATVGNIIFLATAQHNCVHYCLYQYVTFAPNMPYCLMAPPSTDLQTPLLQSDLMALMPPLYNVLIQSLGFYLNYIRANHIGDYDLRQFDGRSDEVIKKYQAKLKDISKEVNARNQERIFPYTLMDPQLMVNSITS